ncbi:DUF3440 domain-containing protein [Salmonella enterica]|nr:DUF3440 domain-containing protein [Salmonella enterica]
MRIAENVYNAYPIYDWCTDDIWTANARFGWDYNQLYDLFYYAGVPLHLMRVAKLATSIKFWRKKGGVLSVEAQEDLRAAGIPFDVGSLTNYKTAKLPRRR